ncbi:hypothetical protein K1719_039451 [Acacia pycnantha]|nr:hypothetical protein K1719_039451 [Acacia pycnantha]
MDDGDIQLSDNAMLLNPESSSDFQKKMTKGKLNQRQEGLQATKKQLESIGRRRRHARLIWRRNSKVCACSMCNSSENCRSRRFLRPSFRGSSSQVAICGNGKFSARWEGNCQPAMVNCQVNTEKKASTKEEGEGEEEEEESIEGNG